MRTVLNAPEPDSVSPSEQMMADLFCDWSELAASERQAARPMYLALCPPEHRSDMTDAMDGHEWISRALAGMTPEQRARIFKSGGAE